MKAPKILPWVARKAGISEALALKLWRRAAGEAEELSGCCNDSNYFHLANQRFLDLVECESGTSIERESTAAPQVGWMWRHQNRMSQLGLLAAQNTCRLWQANWNNFIATQQAAQKRAA